MKKRNRILACLMALVLCAVLLPAAASAAESGSVVRKPKVTFVAGGEIFATVLVPYGDSLGNMPQVPEKAGYMGFWDKTVDIVTGDVTVSAFYTPIDGSAPKNAPDLMWLAIPVVLMSAMAMRMVYKRKEQ